MATLRHRGNWTAGTQLRSTRARIWTQAVSVWTSMGCRRGSVGEAGPGEREKRPWTVPGQRPFPRLHQSLIIDIFYPVPRGVPCQGGSWPVPKQNDFLKNTDLIMTHPSVQMLLPCRKKYSPLGLLCKAVPIRLCSACASAHCIPVIQNPGSRFPFPWVGSSPAHPISPDGCSYQVKPPLQCVVFKDKQFPLWGCWIITDITKTRT